MKLTAVRQKEKKARDLIYEGLKQDGIAVTQPPKFTQYRLGDEDCISIKKPIGTVYPSFMKSQALVASRKRERYE